MQQANFSQILSQCLMRYPTLCPYEVLSSTLQRKHNA